MCGLLGSRGRASQEGIALKCHASMDCTLPYWREESGIALLLRSKTPCFSSKEGGATFGSCLALAKDVV